MADLISEVAMKEQRVHITAWLCMVSVRQESFAIRLFSCATPKDVSVVVSSLPGLPQRDFLAGHSLVPMMRRLASAEIDHPDFGVSQYHSDCSNVGAFLNYY